MLEGEANGLKAQLTRALVRLPTSSKHVLLHEASV
jgi:hypothetical protein